MGVHIMKLVWKSEELTVMGSCFPSQLWVLASHRVDPREPSQITLALSSALKNSFRTLLDNVSKKLRRSAESWHLLLHSVFVAVEKHL